VRDCASGDISGLCLLQQARSLRGSGEVFVWTSSA
jgi:hypothetical protein